MNVLVVIAQPIYVVVYFFLKKCTVNKPQPVDGGARVMTSQGPPDLFTDDFIMEFNNKILQLHLNSANSVLNEEKRGGVMLMSEQGESPWSPDRWRGGSYCNPMMKDEQTDERCLGWRREEVRHPPPASLFRFCVTPLSELHHNTR